MAVRFPIATVNGNGQLSFAEKGDFDRALDLGIFYLRAPDTLDLESARQFGRALLNPESPYRQIPQYGDFEGFIDLENNQQTKLALRRHHWCQHYPASVAQFGQGLDALGMAIMRAVLEASSIPAALWGQASGGYATGAGTAFLNFVHYDTRQPNPGLHPHTDYGFVTLLDVTAPGLQVEIDGVFIDVPILPRHLAVHFGEALRFITRYSQRCVSAVRHQVARQLSASPVRHGIVYFANPDLEGRLWQFDTTGISRGDSSVEALFTELERNLTEYR